MVWIRVWSGLSSFPGILLMDGLGFDVLLCYLSTLLAVVVGDGR